MSDEPRQTAGREPLPGRAGFGEATSLAMLGALEARRGAVYAEALRG